MKRTFLKALLFLFPIFSFAEAAVDHYPAVVLGGGPGALTAAVYLARLGVTPVVLEGQLVGGTIAQSHKVQNWPGELEIAGADLTEKIRVQAKSNGALLLSEEIISADFSKKPYTFTARSVANPEKKRTFTTDACIIAMGTKPNFLGVNGEKKYWGMGVTNCAVCDGPLYKDKVVVVVGGGDAALLEADYLSQIAKKVYLVVRGSTFRTVEEKRMQEILARPNIEVHYQATIREIIGDSQKVTSVLVREKGAEKKLLVDGVFLAIGSKPNTELFGNSLELDSKGYIKLKEGQRTSKSGVYAIGDISDPLYKQAISAAGDGAKAAIEAHRDILSHSTEATLKPSPKKAALSLEVKEPMKDIETVAEFESLVEKSDLPVIVDFYATWCGPCKTILPVFKEKAALLSEKYVFVKVNVETLSALAQKYSIRAMPTMIILEKGKEIERRVGPLEIAKALEQREKNATGKEADEVTR